MYKRQPAAAERNAEQTAGSLFWGETTVARVRRKCARNVLLECGQPCTDRIARDSGCQVGFGKYFLDLSSVLIHSASVSAVAPMNSLVNIDAAFGSAVAPI
jgi:hypothetical protein